MTIIPPNLCCDDDPVDSGSGYPALPPPCTDESCSMGWLNTDRTGGALVGYAKLFGQTADSSELVDTDVEGTEGVLRCFRDADGDLGMGVSLKGSPAPIDSECLDEDGNDLYVNGLRRIRNTDGSVSLGTLPIPLQGKVCAEGSGQCTTTFPPGQEDEVFGSSNDGGCGPSPSVTLKNEGCFPMLVTPKITITDARLGDGVTYQMQPNIQGQFQNSFDVFSNIQGGCTISNAGTGATTTDGTDNHSHDGPSHTHTLSCNVGANTYSGTIDRPLVSIAPGASLTFSVDTSIRYERTVVDGGALNFGKVTVCLDYVSEVTPATIAALEGN